MDPQRFRRRHREEHRREIANLVAQQVPFQDPAVSGRVFQFPTRRVKRA